MEWVDCSDVLDAFEGDPEGFVCIDLETTGLDPEVDGILSLSIVDAAHNVLFDSLLHTYRKKAWGTAQRINGISPRMVRDAPSFSEVREEVQRIIDGARVLCGYNPGFDLGFLMCHGIEIPEAVPVCDVMEDFAYLYGEYVEWLEGPKWQKLTTCAGCYGYGGFGAHESLGDVLATLYCFPLVARGVKPWKQYDRLNHQLMAFLRDYC